MCGLGALEVVADRLEQSPRIGAALQLPGRSIAALLPVAGSFGLRALGSRFESKRVGNNLFGAPQQLLDDRKVRIQARLGLTEGVLDRL